MFVCAEIRLSQRLTEPFRGVVRTMWCRSMYRDWNAQTGIGLLCVSLLSARRQALSFSGKASVRRQYVTD